MELSPAAASFAAHMCAFHAGLPAEEQVLLERIFALAEAAADSKAQAETQGEGMVETDPGEFPNPSLIRTIQFDFPVDFNGILLRKQRRLLPLAAGPSGPSIEG